MVRVAGLNLKPAIETATVCAPAGDAMPAPKLPNASETKSMTTDGRHSNARIILSSW
jgi:hypothetical protein